MRMKLLNVRRRSRLRVLAVLALTAAAVFSLGKIPAVAEWVFARGITRFFGWFIGCVTKLTAVSLYEVTALTLIALGAFFLCVFIADVIRRNYSSAGGVAYRIAEVALVALIVFGAAFAPLYARASANAALGLPSVRAEEASVYRAAEYYVESLNAVSAKISRDEKGNVRSLYTFCDLGERLNDEYARSDGYFSPYRVRPKAVSLSVLMSYLGITGIYFPFTAEANVNVNVPTCDLPVTMAHEMAHAKGVAEESTANLTAYVLLIRSDDAFLQYCGLMDAVASMLNALPQESFDVLYGRLSDEIKKEYSIVRAHYRRYEGVLERISGFFNDLFLKSNGIQSGTKNYGETVNGLVALYYERVGACRADD